MQETQASFRPDFDPAPRSMRAFLELVRAPNVFTAVADILLGFLFTHQFVRPWPALGLLLGSSCLLYLAGMVLNDYFDRDVDAVERPGRPIPSGRVSVGFARGFGFGLLAGGVALGWGAAAFAEQFRPGIIATLLAAAILLYDGGLKRTLAGPLVMGACRMLNVLLGMSTLIGAWEPVHWIVADGIGLYIVGVTWFARTEAVESSRPSLILSTLVMLGGIGLLAWYPNWNSLTGPELTLPEHWVLFWIMLAGLVGMRCTRAIVNPSPRMVQMAVKTSIMSLILLDAAAATPLGDAMWAFTIVALLVPSMFLGRWIYST